MPSIFDISRLTGVSKSTVQRVLSGNGRYSQEVAEKVMKAAKELNYRPNGIARAMKTKQDITPKGVILPSELVIRESTRN